MEHNFRIGDTVTNVTETKVIMDFYKNTFKFEYIVFEGEEVIVREEYLVTKWKRVPAIATYKPIIKEVIAPIVVEDKDEEEEEMPFYGRRKVVIEKAFNNDITKTNFIEL